MARKPLARPQQDTSEQIKDNERPRQTTTPLRERVSSLPNAHVPAGPPNDGHAETCFVACKVGEAWIELQHCEAQEVWEQGRNGGRFIEVNVKSGKIIRVRGTAYPAGQIPVGFPGRPRMAHGFAISAGMDRAFIETWFEQYHLHPMVTNNLIMWDTKLENLQAKCREFKELRSGLEPLVPRINDTDKGDPRDPRPARPADEQTPLQVEESKAKRMRAGTFGGDEEVAA